MNGLKIYAKFLFCMTGLFITALLAGCGGGGGGQGPILGLPTAELVRVVVTPATAIVPGGGTQQFTAIASFIDGSSRDVTADATWSSGTPAVATVVSNTGRATGVATGAAIITAAFGGKAGSATLNVNGSTLLSITVTPGNQSIAVGSTQQFIALGTYSDGSTRDITSISTFSTGSAGVSSVSTGGLATGVATGSAVITATSGTRTGSANLAVTQSTLASIAVIPATANVAIGGTQPFKATATYVNGTTADITTGVTWTSSNNAIATVDATGIATGASNGTATITATSAGRSASATLIVLAGATGGATTAPVSITVTPAKASIATGSTQKFVAVANYADGSTINVTNSAGWVSSNTAIAPVLGTGLATGVNAGTVTISATFGGKSGAAVLEVLSGDSASGATFLITPPAQILAPGVTQRIFATGSYGNGTSVDLTSNVQWTSSNPAIARVDQNGNVTAVAPGTVTIAATNGTARASTDYTVR